MWMDRNEIVCATSSMLLQVAQTWSKSTPIMLCFAWHYPQCQVAKVKKMMNFREHCNQLHNCNSCSKCKNVCRRDSVAWSLNARDWICKRHLKSTQFLAFPLGACAPLSAGRTLLASYANAQCKPWCHRSHRTLLWLKNPWQRILLLCLKPMPQNVYTTLLVYLSNFIPYCELLSNNFTLTSLSSCLPLFHLCLKLSKFSIIGHDTLFLLIKGFCKPLEKHSLKSYTSMQCKHACMHTM